MLSKFWCGGRSRCWLIYRMTPESGPTVLRATPGATAVGAANTRSPFVRLRELIALGGATPLGTITFGVGAATGAWAGWITVGTPVGSGSILNRPLFR